LPLPELLPWRGDGRAPDVEICVGADADALHDGVHVSPLLQIDRHGAARLSIERVASYIVRNGREVTIDPRIDPSLPDVRVFLFGTVLGLLCRQRGLLPLRAACVAIGDKAIALAGAAGRGKSTAAACLALRGHPLVADSVCVIDPFASVGPLVLPGVHYAGLWQSAADALALPENGRLPNRRGQAKYRYPIGDRDRLPTTPMPLAAVYVLEWANRARQAAVIDLHGAQRAVMFRRLLLPRRTTGGRESDAQLFRATAILANRCRVAHLVQEYGFSAARATSTLLESLASA